MRPRAGAGTAVLLVLAGAMPAQADGLFAPWHAGVAAAEPDFQVQRIDADSFAIRQSIHSHPAAPFVYLLFGRERALLIDSGARGRDGTNAALRPVIDAIMVGRRGAGHPGNVPLMVAHSHSHDDHVAGDAAFATRPDTVVVGLAPAAVAAVFGMADWPEGQGQIDLGGRRLTVLATPGHHPAHVMFHDAVSGTLFSGDALQPGRIMVPIDQFAAFRAGIDRVAAFVARHPVARILGAHIEMRALAGEEYAPGARVHHGEHRLELRPESLAHLRAALHASDGEPVRQTLRDFIIVPRWPN